MSKQSSLYPTAHPAPSYGRLVVFVACLVVSPAAAQDRAVVTTVENFRLQPSGTGRILARVSEGTEVSVGASRGGWREVTLEGWIWGASVRASGNQNFDLVVSPAEGENLRAEPNGRILARFETGALLEEMRRADRWVRVRRTAWMWERSLEVTGGNPAVAADAPAGDDAAPPPVESVDLSQRTLAAGTGLLAAPDGDTLGRLSSRGNARIVARAEGWVRVLVEGWVRESDVGPADDSALVGVTAAEVRGAGSAYEGRTLRWTVQVIAVQTADELRRDMPSGQRYLLARGPLPETGFVYVLLTDDQARAIDTLEPLTHITLLGRVRAARSQYLGNPVLDLLGFAVERE